MLNADQSPYSLKNKVALITGAAKGIGLACATTLAEQGAEVVITDVDIDGLNVACQSIQDAGYPCTSLIQDVSEESAWEEVMSLITKRLGGLDILVNNAGIYIGGLLIKSNLEDLHHAYRINVDSILLGLKYGAEKMRKNKHGGRGGSIINLSSVAGLIGVPGHSAYGSTKGAVRSYSKHAAVEFAKMGYGIRVNSVHPGLIDTEMGQKVYQDLIDIGMATNLEQAQNIICQMIPMGNIGCTQDVANMVLFLASDASAYITGSEFIIDGGMTAA